MPAISGPFAHSPGHQEHRRYYDQLRARGKTHHQALRQLGNRLVGILHVCLEREVLYDESVAWTEGVNWRLDELATWGV